MGMPKYVLADRGTPFMGEYWTQMDEIYGTIAINAPTKAAYQIGGAERIGSLIKDIFTAGWKANEYGRSQQEVLAMACLSKNSTPHTALGLSLSPLQVLTGRADCLDFLNNADNSSLNLDSEPAQTMWGRVTFLHNLMDQLSTRHAQKMMRMIDSTQIRAQATDAYRHNDIVQQRNPLGEVRNGAFRCVFDSGRNVYVERGNVIQKAPRRWVRVRGVIPRSCVKMKHKSWRYLGVTNRNRKQRIIVWPQKVKLHYPLTLTLTLRHRVVVVQIPIPLTDVRRTN